MRKMNTDTKAKQREVLALKDRTADFGRERAANMVVRLEKGEVGFFSACVCNLFPCLPSGFFRKKHVTR
jgi:hypothetical protein